MQLLLKESDNNKTRDVGITEQKKKTKTNKQTKNKTKQKGQGKQSRDDSIKQLSIQPTLYISLP